MKREESGQTDIQVLLVDDHQMVLEGIRTLLRAEQDIQVVGQASNREEALQLLEALPQVQVVLIDLNIPGAEGVELIRSMKQQKPQVQILALASLADAATIQAVLGAGGTGYLLKNSTKSELVQAIRQVAASNTFFSQEAAATLLQHLDIPARRAPQVVPALLTERERQVLGLIVQEYSNNRIAEELFISERTVETHRKNILAKTNSKSIVGLIKYAFRHKLIS
ncbi:response regulator transcription factor [Hymenobacter sp. BT730]|uniref:response regulator n=1 Tax=Hymenobacter sp. BT730 TaxID=3063332 RepID=UPI0026E06533|nr:response regulator transcription factor [Hymenobacter sp. BT730]